MLESIIKHILVPEEEIQSIVRRLGEEINRDYADKNLIIVCVLKGSLMFTADLAKQLNLVSEMEFVRVSTYGNATESSGEMKMLLDFERDDIEQCDLLIIEDIIDSGNTLSRLAPIFRSRNPKSLTICTLLDKPDRRVVNDVKVDYTGFTIPDEFVVGFGLDYNQKYRNLPFIGSVVMNEI